MTDLNLIYYLFQSNKSVFIAEDSINCLFVSNRKFILTETKFLFEPDKIYLK